MALIHPSSYVDAKAEIADDVEIGPFCIVEAGVKIGAGSKLDSHVILKSGTEIGRENYIGQSAVLGGAPQDRKYDDAPTYLKIGDRNKIREYVTMHRATGEGMSTVVGNDCYIMAYCHLGHNATLHDSVTMANLVQLSGHVTVEEKVTIGGFVGVHQYVRIGKISMVGGFGKIVRDVPPFMIYNAVEEKVADINAVGLRRVGVKPDARLALHKACKLIFRSQLGLDNALAAVRRELPHTAEIEYLVKFLERLYRGKNGRGDQP
ncbi:MAG: acyl-[acyl-carrier-protein]--UDP-N-acetylglucosamine O-acyltransferase [Armatimonadetes bacterium]|nr:MAG: acyl-[acyl-carrier-protein]--UDP-N-acetylglucosamine O-acyltransferase [Armatimonadota bacterium]